MIEFEKWAKTKKPYDPFCCHGMMEAAWKAALEWALEQDTWIGPDEGGAWGIDKYAIEEELNGEA